jgi:hypothetical protein
VTGKEEESSFCAMLDPVTTISASSGVGAVAVVSVSAAITGPPNPTRDAPTINAPIAIRIRNWNPEHAGRASPSRFPILIVVPLERVICGGVLAGAKTPVV